jgi:hypothetical protein
MTLLGSRCDCATWNRAREFHGNPVAVSQQELRVVGEVQQWIVGGGSNRPAKARLAVTGRPRAW